MFDGKIWVQRYDGNDPNSWDLSRVLLNDDLKPLIRELIKKRYPDRLSIWVGPFAAFNNHPSTTEEEVVALLEEARR